MAVRRYVNVELWEDSYIQSLRPLQRYLWVYLITNPKCTIAGVYEVTPNTISRLTGLSAKQVKEYMEAFCKAKKVVYRNNWIILANAPKHQHWEKSEPVKKGIEACLRRAPAWVLCGIREGQIPYAYPIDRVPIPPTYGIHTPGYGLASYSDLDLDIDLDSDRAPVENLLGNLGDKSAVGTRREAGAMKVRAKELGTPVEER